MIVLKFRSRVFFCMLVSSLMACTTTVQLELNNTEDFDIAQTRIEVKKKDQSYDQTIQLGPLKGNGQLAKEFTVEDGSNLEVVAIHNGAKVCCLAKWTILGDKDPEEVRHNVRVETRMLDDESSLEMIQKSFKNLGEDLGIQPRNVLNTLQTLFGGIVIILPGEDGGKPRLLAQVNVNELKVRETKLDEIRYGSGYEDESVVISGSAANTAKVNVGPWGAFGFHYNSEDVYELKWILKGFGMIDKTEDPNFNHILQYKKLNQKILDHHLAMLEKYPKAKVYYINKMYAIESAQMFRKRAKKVQAGTEIDVLNIVTASGVYKFENKIDETKSYGPSVLNLSGEELIVKRKETKFFWMGRDPDPSPVLVQAGDTSKKFKAQELLP